MFQDDRRCHAQAVVPLILGAAITALALPAGAGAATIHACVNKHSGATRIVSASKRCHAGEQKLSWNAKGPAGPAGKNGTNGANGSNGTDGVDGAVAGFYASTPEGERQTFPEGKEAILVQKIVPPGSYLVFATSVLEAEAATAAEAKKGIILICDVFDSPGTSYTPAGSSDLDEEGWETSLAERSPTAFDAFASEAWSGELDSSVTTTLALVCGELGGGAGSPTASAASSHLSAVQTSHNS
jgi:hypothetical protein